MQSKTDQYENNPNFHEFLDREFDKTAANATIEDLAEFAFGSIDTAIQVFEEYRKT